MIKKWKSTGVLKRVGLLVTVIMAVVIATASVYVVVVLPLTQSPLSQEDLQYSVQKGIESGAEDELVEIARDWAEDNVDGEAGDEMVEFIVEMSTTRQPEMLGQFLKERLRSATTWTYGPIVNQSGDIYEVTATASTHVHEIVPSKTYVPEGMPTPGPFERVATMPFHLTIDLESRGISDWHTHADESAYRETAPVGVSMVSVEEAFGETAADCIHSALALKLSDSLASAVLTEPIEREPTAAIQLKEAINTAGLRDLCEEWIDGSSQEGG